MLIISKLQNSLNRLNINVGEIEKISKIKIDFAILTNLFIGNMTKSIFEIMTILFELVDNKIFNEQWRKEKYIPKGFYQRSLTFKNGTINFKRRKYVLKSEFYQVKNNYVFLLDKELGIDNYQRTDFDLQQEMLQKIGSNFSYQDIVNLFPYANLTKMTVFNQIKKFDVSNLENRINEKNENKLNHNGLIYIETDETYKNAIKYEKGVKKLIKKRIRLTLIHTGYKNPNVKRKEIKNKKILITSVNEKENINSEKYWKSVAEFIENNYHDSKEAQWLVLGDGAKYIVNSESFIDATFIIDRFHISQALIIVLLNEEI